MKTTTKKNQKKRVPMVFRGTGRYKSTYFLTVSKEVAEDAVQMYIGYDRSGVYRGWVPDPSKPKSRRPTEYLQSFCSRGWKAFGFPELTPGQFFRVAPFFREVKRAK